MKQVPALGIIGEKALREAAAGSYEQIMGLITVALRAVYAQAGDWDPWPYVKAMFPDSVVIARDGKCWRYPYSYDQASNTVTLGDPVEVLETFVTVGGMTEARRDGVFMEAVGGADGKPPSRYRIRVIRAGLSGNGNYYPDTVLREAVPLFDGARVFVKGDAEHLAGGGRDFRNLIGGLKAPKFVDGRGSEDSRFPDRGEVQAEFELLNPSGPEAVKLHEAWQRGMTGLFGFSIDATAYARASSRGGRNVREATKFTEVKSVDLIVVPGAGGQVIGLVEAKAEDIMNREQLISLLEGQGLLKGKKVEDLSDDKLQELLREALAAPKTASAPTGVTVEQLAETLRMVEARSYARATIAASPLPTLAKQKLTTRFTELTSFKEAEVDKAIADEKSYIASLTESGRVTGLGDFPRIEPGEDRATKVAEMFDAFFDPEHKDHRKARSIRECYIAVTGDRRVTGRPEECDQALLRESLGATTWSNVLGNSITRRMIADYRRPDRYALWRQICNVVSVNDFRSNERTRIGGYGDLPIVTEGAAYLAQTSPADEKATYTVAKRGGTEDITLEMIRNDDVGVVQQIPIRFSRAAKRTLSKFVFDFLRTNPTVYDAIAFFHASHNNLFASALDATQLAAHRLAMLKQTELTSADRIGISPTMLVVPLDVEETAFNLFRLNTNNDKTFIQQLTLTIIPVWYWTDTNDWHTMADPMDIPTIEVGFLDGNEEPELFVQDLPNVGSMFANDKLTYKLRHIYGGNVLDFRGATKAVV